MVKKLAKIARLLAILAKLSGKLDILPEYSVYVCWKW
jgi:hypothetical protein